MSSAQWQLFGLEPGVQNTDLYNLLSLLKNARAGSTTKAYINDFRRFSDWCTSKLFCALPSKPLYIGLFVSHLVSQGLGSSTVVQYVSAISWVHRMSGLPDPGADTLCRFAVDSARRQLPKNQNRKQVLSIELLTKICESLDSKSLSDARTRAFILIGFVGFLRYSEIAGLRACDVKLTNQKVAWLFIEKSKTDIYRDGAWVPVPYTGKVTCPLSALKNYLSLGDISLDSETSLFRCLRFDRAVGTTVLNSRPLTYTRALELFRSALAPFCADPTVYGLHSLRSGGATSAAANNVSDRLIKIHGRWRSESSKDRYIKHTEKAKLSLVSKLGL